MISSQFLIRIYDGGFKLVLMLRILLALTFIATFAVAFTSAQIRRNPVNNDRPSGLQRSDRDDSPLGDPAREVMERSIIARSVADHRENIERAEENARLGAQLRARFANNHPFGREEIRQLERMESLSRRIRSASGGSSVSISLENEPREMADAIAQLAERSDRLKEAVERTPRRVISMTIIEQVNELLAVINRVRAFARQ